MAAIEHQQDDHMLATEFISYPLRVNSSIGRFASELEYSRYVEQLIRQVLLTSPGERIHRPHFGAGLRQMVFAPNDPTSARLVEATTRHALEKWLGSLITVADVTASSIGESLVVVVGYTTRSRGEQNLLSVEVAL